jgi:hypothetical protein
MELLPCAHCGGEAKIELVESHEEGVNSVVISCLGECGCGIIRFKIIAEAIKAWNTRPTQADDLLREVLASVGHILGTSPFLNKLHNKIETYLEGRK